MSFISDYLEKRARQKAKEKRRLEARRKSMSPQRFEVYMKRRRQNRIKAYIFRAIALILLIVLLVLVCMFIRFAVTSISGLIGSGKKQPAATEEVDVTLEQGEKTVSLGTTGSILLHGPVLNAGLKSNGSYDFSYMFEHIAPYYKSVDFMTCEFEGVLGGEEMGYSGYPDFCSPDVIIENIRDSGVDLQFYATNHMYDGESTAFQRTLSVYNKDGIAMVGARSSTSVPRYYIADIDGVKVGYTDYVYEENYDSDEPAVNGYVFSSGDVDLVNTFNYDKLDDFYTEMADNIAGMKADGAQFIVAGMHWGTEYNLTPNADQQAIAQKLSDLGVNAIFGGHPHCEQPVDVITSSDGSNKMLCVYSVGNELSNQRKELISEMPDGHTEDGAIVRVILKQDSQSNVQIADVDLIPTWVYLDEDEEGNGRYYILAVDDPAQVESTTGISGIQADAQASHDRTMSVMGDGISKAHSAYAN